MRILRFDSVGGASGDMILGVLIGLGADPAVLERELDALLPDHFHLRVEPAARKIPDGTYRNSTQLIGRDGEIAGIYDKNYPTVGEHLKSGIIPGKDATTVKAKYGPGVTISDPGYVGAVLLSSNLDDVTSADMVKEFKIELWDEYYRRSAGHRDRVLEAQPQPKARPCCSASFDRK